MGKTHREGLTIRETIRVALFERLTLRQAIGVIALRPTHEHVRLLENGLSPFRGGKDSDKTSQ